METQLKPEQNFNVICVCCSFVWYPLLSFLYLLLYSSFNFFASNFFLSSFWFYVGSCSIFIFFSIYSFIFISTIALLLLYFALFFTLFVPYFIVVVVFKRFFFCFFFFTMILLLLLHLQKMRNKIILLSFLLLYL